MIFNPVNHRVTSSSYFAILSLTVLFSFLLDCFQHQRVTEVCNPHDLYQVTQSHSQMSNLSKCHAFALLMQLEDRSPSFQLSLQVDYHPKPYLGRKSGAAVTQHFLSTSRMRHWAEEKQTHIMKCGRQQHIQITVKLSVKQGLLERHKLRKQVLGEGRINSVGILLKSSQKSIVCGGA